jgi:hypothetical protein
MFRSLAPLVAEAYLELGMRGVFLMDCVSKALISQKHQ